MNPNPTQPPQGSQEDTETKHFLTSKTIIGILMMLVGWLNNRFDLGLTGQDNELITQDLLAVIGGVVSIWGRARAKKKVGIRSDNVPRLWMSIVLLCLVLPFALAGCAFMAKYITAEGHEIRATVGDGRASVGGSFRPGGGKEVIEADWEFSRQQADAEVAGLIMANSLSEGVRALTLNPKGFAK